MASSKNVRFVMRAKDETSAAFRSVNKRLTRLNNNIRNGAAAVAGFFAFRGATRAIDALIDKFDEINKRARGLQLDPAFLRQLEGAADVIGISSGELTKLVIALRETSGGLVDSVGVRALEQLGINLQEFNKLSAENQVLILADQLKAVENATDRTAASVAILGKRLGLAALKLSDVGAEAFADELENQKRFGSESIKEAGAWAETFNDVTGNAWRSFENNAIRAFGNVLKGMFDTTDELLRIGNNWAEAIADVDLFSSPFSIIKQTIVGTFIKAKEESVVEIEKIGDATNKLLADLRKTPDLISAITLGDKGRKASEEVFKAAEANAKALVKEYNRILDLAKAIREASQQDFDTVLRGIDILLARLERARGTVGGVNRSQTDVTSRPVSEQQRRLEGVKAHAAQLEANRILKEMLAVTSRNQVARFF